MKNDIEALRGFANSLVDSINNADYLYVFDTALSYGLIDSMGKPTEILTGSKDSISDAQRRLYWSWMTDLSKSRIESMKGGNKEYWHWTMKLRYLVPIFIRDDSEFAEMYSIYEKIITYVSYLEEDTVKEKFLGDLSITDATPQQATEYLNDIELFCHSQGVMLRTDTTIYKQAFGR